MPELQGKLIVKGEAQEFGVNNFKVRKFVVEIENERDPQWNQFRELQLTKDKCDMLDAYEIGEEVKVQFNLDGRAWEKDGVTKYFNQDSAWRIEKVVSANVPANNVPEFKAENTDNEEEQDLPF